MPGIAMASLSYFLRPWQPFDSIGFVQHRKSEGQVWFCCIVEA
jgi:hypothetical protein